MVGRGGLASNLFIIIVGSGIYRHRAETCFLSFLYICGNQEKGNKLKGNTGDDDEEAGLSFSTHIHIIYNNTPAFCFWFDKEKGVNILFKTLHFTIQTVMSFSHFPNTVRRFLRSGRKFSVKTD